VTSLLRSVRRFGLRRAARAWWNGQKVELDRAVGQVGESFRAERDPRPSMPGYRMNRAERRRKARA
jgi:hypothetical protein